MSECPFCHTEFSEDVLQQGRCAVCGERVSPEEVVSDVFREDVGVVKESRDPDPTLPLTVDVDTNQLFSASMDLENTTKGVGAERPNRSVLPRALSTENERLLRATWGSSVLPQTDVHQTIKLKSTSAQTLQGSFSVPARAVRSSDTVDKKGVDYELLDVIGKGGMGVVYKARQSSVDRMVAVKMLKPQISSIEDQRGKFVSEAVVTGDLDHPNIVPIYELGTNEDGALFYSMKHVKGTPWSDVLLYKTVAENVEILMKVADAVAFAHASGVIHRDLKPQNIMLGDFGEVLVMDWGLALATSNFRHARFTTLSESMGGTPAYMAPEMATGPFELIGMVSDVYLLGALLYEIITNQRPHRGSNAMDCLRAAACNEIQSTDYTGELLNIAQRAMVTEPGDRYRSVQDFQAAIREYQSHSESIVLASRAGDELDHAQKASDYQAYARALFGYEEALVLWPDNKEASSGSHRTKIAYAQCAHGKGDYDLGLSLLDKDNLDHRELIDRLRQSQCERDARQRRLRNTKRFVGVLATTIFLIVIGAFFWIRRERDRAIVAEKQADQDRDRAVVAEKQADQDRDRAVVAEKQADQDRDRAVVAERMAVDQKEKAIAAKNEAVNQRKLAQQARDRAVAAKQAEQYESYIARIGLAAARIDDNAFDSALRVLEECNETLRHWEWGRLMYLCKQGAKTMDGKSRIDAVAFDREGQRFVTTDLDGQVQVWSVDSGKPLWKGQHDQYVQTAAFSPDGIFLATGGSDAKINVWNSVDGTLVRTLSGHRDAVLSVVFSKDGNRLLSSSYDHTARLWDLDSERSWVVDGHGWWVWTAAFAPDEQQIVTAGQDGKVIVWSVVADGQGYTFNKRSEFLEHQGPVYAATFGPQGKYVVSGGHDKSVLVWNPVNVPPVDIKKRLAGETDQAIPYLRLTGHTGPVRTVRYSPDGRYVLSGSHDNSVKLWEVRRGQCAKTFRGHASWVRSCVFSPDGLKVLSGSYDSKVKLWDIDGYEEVQILEHRQLDGHTDAVLAAAFSPDGSQIVTVSRDRTARTWSKATGDLLRVFEEGHQFLVSTAAFSPDGRQLATSAGDNTTRVWDVASGTQSLVLYNTGRSGVVSISADGKWILTGGSLETGAQLWDARTGKLHVFPGESFGKGHRGVITAVAISSDSRQFMTGDQRGDCKIWSAQTGEETHALRGHSGGITAARFLPDGQRLLTSSTDNSVGHWDLTTGQEITSLILKHPDSVLSLDVSTDGRFALTACADPAQRVILWNVLRGTKVRVLIESGEPINSVAFSPDGQRAVTTGTDRTVRIWEVNTGQEIVSGDKEVVETSSLKLGDGRIPVWSALFSPDGNRLVTLGGNDARLWDLTTRKEILRFSPHGAVTSVGYSPDSKLIVTGSWDGSAKIWNVATGMASGKLFGRHRERVHSVIFSPKAGDGTVLTAMDDGTAKLWDVKKRRAIRTFVTKSDQVFCATFSPDASLVLATTDDGQVWIWHRETGRLLREFSGHDYAVLGAVFSPNNQWIMTGSEDNTAKIWGVGDGRLLATVSGHTAAVTSVAFSPDGRRAVTGSRDGTAKIWDASRLGREFGMREVLTLNGHDQEVESVGFSPDGYTVLTAGRDGTAALWTAEDWKVSKLARE